MDSLIILLVLVVIVIGGAYLWSQHRAKVRQRELDDAKAEARRWVERLGGQVINLVGTDDASKQALADASERYTAAGSQLEQANSTQQAKLVTQTALEGLFYVRAARTAMGMDPGPELPDLAGQRGAGQVTEDREVEVEGEQYAASPNPSERTPHYYPGGQVAGRPVPQGWYSQPWWKPALVAGAWGAGSFLLMSAMFGGMAGVPMAAADPGGAGDMGGEAGGDMGGDAGGDMGDPGMGDMGDGGGFDFGDFGF